MVVWADSGKIYMKLVEGNSCLQRMWGSKDVFRDQQLVVSCLDLNYCPFREDQFPQCGLDVVRSQQAVAAAKPRLKRLRRFNPMICFANHCFFGEAEKGGFAAGTRASASTSASPVLLLCPNRYTPLPAKQPSDLAQLTANNYFPTTDCFFPPIMLYYLPQDI